MESADGVGEASGRDRGSRKVIGAALSIEKG